MKASHNQPVQRKGRKTNTAWESEIQASTKGDAWSATFYVANTHESATGVDACDSVEELEEMMGKTAIPDRDSTTSGEGESLAPSTSAASTDVNYGSVNVPTSNGSTASWMTLPSLDGHDRGGYNYNYDHYPTVPAGDGPYRYDHARLGGDVSQLSPLEMWKGTYERHEHIAYRLKKPARKCKASKKTRSKRH
jgi:hypothetical protein